MARLCVAVRTHAAVAAASAVRCQVMALRDVSRDAVLAAIAECDAAGPEEFLNRHGFGRARSLLLEYEGRRYDSKAIVGVAHGKVPGQRPLRWDEFTGGANSVARKLVQLGFHVVDVKSPNWAWDELVLVCDLMANRQGRHQPWSRLLQEHQDVIELSELLQILPSHPEEKQGLRFRSPSAVARKGENIRQWHKEFDGKPNNGGAHDKDVHDAFVTDPEGMRQAAHAIRAELLAGHLEDLPQLDVDVDEGIMEGSVLQRLSFARERNPALRRRKIKEVLDQHGKLACEVCAFDFERTYGERGAGFAEVHHAVPLHVTGPVKNHTTDLVILCSNCHRMIHRGKKWLTPEDLRALLTASLG